MEILIFQNTRAYLWEILQTIQSNCFYFRFLLCVLCCTLIRSILKTVATLVSLMSALKYGSSPVSPMFSASATANFALRFSFLNNFVPNCILWMKNHRKRRGECFPVGLVWFIKSRKKHAPLIKWVNRWIPDRTLALLPTWMGLYYQLLSAKCSTS